MFLLVPFDNMSVPISSFFNMRVPFEERQGDFMVSHPNEVAMRPSGLQETAANWRRSKEASKNVK